MPELIIESREAVVSRHMSVKRTLPFRQRRMVGPFIFMDHGGPVPEITNPAMFDILPHPHIGISTISYLFSGQLLHRDSLGSEQVIRPGEVNWMTAGRGIAHSERMGKIAADSAGLELIQTWVALPEKEEESSPTFRNYPADQLPVSMDNGVWMKLIAGKAYGMQNEVRVNSPLFYLHIRMEQHSIFGLPREYSERAVYIAHGNLEIAGINYHQGQMLVFNETENPVIKAQETCTLMLIGGEPLGQRFIWWNFVSSRAERIEEAKEDWKQGRIPLPPNDNKEFIPLPEDVLKPTQQPPKPEPLS